MSVNAEGIDEGARKKERKVANRLRQDVRSVFNSRQKVGQKEDWLTSRLKADLQQIGRFYRTEDGVPFFLRHSERRLYEVNGKPDSDFARLVTYLADVSVKADMVNRCLDRLGAWIVHEAEIVHVHALAYNSPDAETIAINDFGGGMWYRRRGSAWESKPNGSEGILFWTPPEFVERWKPEFSTDPAIQDEDHLQWFLEQPHFGEDVLTVVDQRMLLRTLVLSLFFPSRNRTRPVPAHLPPTQRDQRQHDTGKTTGGKVIGHLLVGSKFEPTPLDGSEKGQEGFHLALMNQPFVLADNADTDIKWLNDLLCTYATGGRLPRRKLYEDTTLLYYEPRGRLCITSRKVKFNRPDTASRVIPFRFKPISEAERRTEPELLDPVDARRGRIWAGLLSAVARLQDALPELSPPSPSSRLADFESFGWCVATVYGDTPACPERGAQGRRRSRAADLRVLQAPVQDCPGDRPRPGGAPQCSGLHGPDQRPARVAGVGSGRANCRAHPPWPDPHSDHPGIELGRLRGDRGDRVLGTLEGNEGRET
jgi:hypothetical protein